MAVNPIYRRFEKELEKRFLTSTAQEYTVIKPRVSRLIGRVLEPSSFLENAKEILRKSQDTRFLKRSESEILRAYEECLYGTWRELAYGTFLPKPPNMVPIPKPNGGTRMIAVFSVRDSIAQTAIEKTLNGHVNRLLHRRSMAYRPGVSMASAVRTVESLIVDKNLVTLNVDIEKCFDNIDHQLLWERLSAAVQGDEIARFTRSVLDFGNSPNINVAGSKVGIPQGSPLSPLLVNIYLDDFDRAMENIGAEFVRYSDNIAVFAKSKNKASRLLDKTVEFIAQSKLKLHSDGLKIQPAWGMEFLGYQFVSRPDTTVKIVLSEKKRNQIAGKIDEALTSSLSAAPELRNAKQVFNRSELPLTRYLSSLHASYAVSHDWSSLQLAILHAMDCAAKAGYSGWFDGEFIQRAKREYRLLHQKVWQQPVYL